MTNAEVGYSRHSSLLWQVGAEVTRDRPASWSAEAQPSGIRIMPTLRAVVRKGRLVLNEPTDLPEGTEIELAAADLADDLDEEERARLHAELEKSWASATAGPVFPVEDLLRKLKDVG